jgi:hypothetical protein
MAEELPNHSESFPIDRRSLLTTSVAITTAILAPGVAISEIAPGVSGQPILTKAEAILNVSATTARRLAEIERRNELRRKAQLPLLPIAKELRRMKEEDDRQEFSEAFRKFAAKYSKAVWDEVLKPRREALGDPNWRPKYWSEGVGYQSEVYRILRERFTVENEPHTVKR